jgi:hypothetical protein
VGKQGANAALNTGSIMEKGSGTETQVGKQNAIRK